MSHRSKGVSERTPEREARILGALRAGNFRSTAATLAGISRSTLYDWMARDPGLLAQVKRAEAESEEQVVADILNDEKDQRTKLKLLGMRHPKRFRESTEKHVKHSYETMSDEELARKRDELWQRYKREHHERDSRPN